MQNLTAYKRIDKTTTEVTDYYDNLSPRSVGLTMKRNYVGRTKWWCESYQCYFLYMLLSRWRSWLIIPGIPTFWLVSFPWWLPLVDYVPFWSIFCAQTKVTMKMACCFCQMEATASCYLCSSMAMRPCAVWTFCVHAFLCFCHWLYRYCRPRFVFVSATKFAIFALPIHCVVVQWWPILPLTWSVWHWCDAPWCVPIDVVLEPLDRQPLWHIRQRRPPKDLFVINPGIVH